MIDLGRITGSEQSEYDPHRRLWGRALQRHWEDAELLFSEKRLANADHLYGFSAECGLKAVMEALGMGGRSEREAYKAEGPGPYRDPLDSIPVVCFGTGRSTILKTASIGHAVPELVG